MTIGLLPAALGAFLQAAWDAMPTVSLLEAAISALTMLLRPGRLGPG